MDTTTMCVSTMVRGFRNEVTTMRDKLAEVQAKICNPIDLFTKHYTDENRTLMEQAKKFHNGLEAQRRVIEKSMAKYFADCENKEAAEASMMEKIKEHEDGIITFEEFQEVSNKMVNVKYKAEVSF
jgi:uncharacterized UPF0160 family protein